MTKTKEVTTLLPELNPVAAKTQATKTSNEATELVIASPEDVATATELVSKIKAANKLIDAEEGKMLSHLKASIKTEKERWQSMRDLYDAAEEKLRKDIMTYRADEQRKLAQATAQVNAAVASGKIKKETTAISKINALEGAAMGKSVSTGTATASFRTVYKLKITDESKIPRVYMVPALKLIEATLKAGKTVAGCSMEPEEQLAVK